MTDTPDGKQEWRARLRAAREKVAPEVRALRAAELTAGVLRLAAGTGGPVCAYVPVGTEPGSPEVLDALRAAGHEVLLPIVPPRPGPLEWASHDGGFAPGPLGLREPTGPRLGPTAIERARLVLVPALAADRRGIRLGQGGGYYDRSLPLAAPAARVVVVLDDGELVAELPAEPHDVRVPAALQPTAGVTTLGL